MEDIAVSRTVRDTNNTCASCGIVMGVQTTNDPGTMRLFPFLEKEILLEVHAVGGNSAFGSGF